MSDLNRLLVESRWEEQTDTFIPSTQLDRLYRVALARLTGSPSGLDVARELASDYLPADGSGFSGSHKEGSGLPEDYWPRVALQYGAQGHLWSQCRDGKLSLYARGDDRYFRAPHDDLFELPATLDWEATFDRGILTGGRLPPVAWKHVHLLRPQVWVTDEQAQAALRALDGRLIDFARHRRPTDSELEEMIRAAHDGKIPAKKAAWETIRDMRLGFRQQEVFHLVERIVERDKLDRTGGRPPKLKPS
jgi:hypothetical protein